MKQRDWVKEWEVANKETWAVFNQGGRCYGLVVSDEWRIDKKQRLLIRCKCDMEKTRPKATNNIQLKNIESWHDTYEDARHAYYYTR